MIIHYHVHQFHCEHCDHVGELQKVDDLANLDETKHMKTHHDDILKQQERKNRHYTQRY